MLNSVLKISPEELDSLDRLRLSETMKRAPQVLRVLDYIIDRFLAGEGDSINESSIGQAVFHRPEGYNRGDDNIVRVTVRHLRSRLEHFYATEGAGESSVLEIPKGKYCPVLKQRIAITDLLTEPAAAPIRPALVQGNRWLWLCCAALLISTVILGVSLIRRPSAAPAKDFGLVQSLFSRNELPVWLVVTDSNLQVFRRLFQKTVTLSEYLEKSYIPPPALSENPMLPGAWKFIDGSRDTSLSSTLVAVRLQDAGIPTIVRVRHPHDLRIRDFQQDNVILLGGPWVNPWGQLFEERLNFRLMPPTSDAALSQIINTSPAPGEPKIYAPHNEGSFAVSYARLAVVPNLSNSSWLDTGKVVLVGATTNQAVEASGDFLVNPRTFKNLLARFHALNIQELSPFELVLEVRSIDSTPRSVSVIAQRVVAWPH